MEIGQRIRALREAHDMTLEELGQKVGVGKSTVRKWETGMIANMRRDKIAKLSDALNVTPAYLMGWDESKSPAAEEIILTDHEKDLVLSYRLADAGTRSAVCKLLDVEEKGLEESEAG